MEAAQAAGVSMVTHLFNAMPAFHPRARPLIAPFIPASDYCVRLSEFDSL
jgi:N-acetylglucosamine-6-phosphate deacetylase